MPIDLSNTLKSTCGWSFASKGMNGIFVSKFYTSSFLTIIIIVLIMILYPCQRNTPALILVKLGFYIFLASLGMIFIHDCVVYHEYEKEVSGQNSDDFVELISEKNVAFGGTTDVIPVIPNQHNSDNQPDADITDKNTDVVGGDAAKIFDMYGV